MAHDARSEEHMPFPCRYDHAVPMSAEEQRRTLKELSIRLGRVLRREGRATVAAHDDRERGLLHDAALAAGMRLDRAVTGRTAQDGAVLVWVDDAETEPTPAASPPRAG